MDIRNPFWGKIRLADDLESEDIKVMFEPNRVWEGILEPLNQIIIGTTGTGKSMFLKKLSASTMNEDDFPKTHMFFGIYLHVSRITRYFNTILDSIIRSIDDDRIFWNKKLLVTINIYSQYLCLWLLERLCEEIEYSSNYPFYPWNKPEIKKGLIKDICNLLDIKKCEDLEDIIVQIKDQIFEIDNYFSSDWLIKDNIEIRLFRYLNIHTLPEAITKIILGRYNSDNAHPKKRLYVYFLLDTSEYIHPECQKVHNSFFERGFSFRTKLAKRPYHLNTPETLSGKSIKQDTEFSVIFLDYPPSDKESYKNFLINVLGKELKYIKENYSEYGNIVIDPLEFLDMKENNGKFDLFSICSMGVCTRDFINIVGNAFDLLLKEKNFEGKIPYDYQERALFQYSEIQLALIPKIEQLDKTIIPEKYPLDKINPLYDFFTGMLRKLKDENRKMNELIIEVDELFMPEDIQVFLKPAFAEGVFKFISLESPFLFITPNKFCVNPLFLQVPRFSLFGKDSYTHTLNVEDIRNLTKRYFRKSRAGKLQPSEKYTAFLSCSFEEKPFSKESRLLIKSSLQQVGIECYDAEDLDITFQTKGIADKIKESNFIIAELSFPTPNIMFEIGVGMAYKKTIIPIVNREEIPINDILTLLELPMNIRQYDLNDESLMEVAKQIRNLVNIRITQEGNIEELSSKETNSGRSLRPKQLPKMIFISYPKEHAASWNKAVETIKNKLQGWTIITEETSGLQSREAVKFMVPIYCISSSKFCIIDTTGREKPDLFQSYVLGISFGLNKNTLRIEGSGLSKKEGLSLWSSHPYERWRNIEELTNKISKFVEQHKKRGGNK